MDCGKRAVLTEMTGNRRLIETDDKIKVEAKELIDY